MNGEGLAPAHKFAWALLVVAVAGLVSYAFWKKTRIIEPDLTGRNSPQLGVPRSDAPKPEDLAVYDQVKKFTLTDQHGKNVEAKDLLGEVWVANFIFTHCAGTCPLITRQMAELDKELADLPSVKLISFSMDPENDTPDVLAKYAFTQDAVSPRWKFLTGTKDEIYRVTKEEFKLVVDDKNGTKAEPIIHSTKIVLVDAQGFIRGRFDAFGMDGPKPEAIKLLAASVRKLRSLPPVKTDSK